ncbi:homocysteine S-methyltransferase 3-like [Impatiens glandulifera]|uniref:homocysteine S-methyltransferase 3-like n=1 Tax=Impatiens glandulifera TaxID=253017 RepID=UPI001FB130EF|nr:homocysteine S-methyltransferase 3-like [Impatiens glandulifera]
MGYDTLQPSGLMSDFIRQCGGYAVVDGGLATELEHHGADLNDPLWSGKCLIGSPHLIRKVHLDYLEAGANVIISASYQATLQGFEARGLSKEQGEALLRKSVEIAREARDIFRSSRMRKLPDNSSSSSFVQPILVAASVGSYGAFLADGSEYSGNYGDSITLQTLKDFHRRRVQVLAKSGADLIAFETIPNKLEAQAFAELVEEENIKIPAWLSFSSRDGLNVANGDPITECAAVADTCKQVVAVGINCTAPRFVHGLIQSIRTVTAKPVVIYPNSGESYDAVSKKWVPTNEEEEEEDGDFVSYVAKWHEAGASLIGGCCRTTPKTIKAISKALSSHHHTDDT